MSPFESVRGNWMYYSYKSHTYKTHAKRERGSWSWRTHCHHPHRAGLTTEVDERTSKRVLFNYLIFPALSWFTVVGEGIRGSRGGGSRPCTSPWCWSAVVVNWIHSWHIRFNCWNRRERQPAEAETTWFDFDGSFFLAFGFRGTKLLLTVTQLVACSRHGKTSNCAFKTVTDCLIQYWIPPGTKFHWISIFNKDQVVDGTFVWCGKFCTRSHRNHLRKETISQSVYLLAIVVNSYRIFMPRRSARFWRHAPLGEEQAVRANTKGKHIPSGIPTQNTNFELCGPLRAWNRRTGSDKIFQIVLSLCSL